MLFSRLAAAVILGSTLLLPACDAPEGAEGSAFVSDHEGCSQDIWKLAKFQHELTLEGTKMKVALDSEVTAEKADELLAVIADANRLLPAGIEAPKELHVLICNTGPVSYSTSFGKTPVVVTPIRLQIANEATSLDNSKAVFLHEYSHIVFEKYLVAHSKGYAAYQKLGNQYVNKIEEFNAASPRDPNYLSLRLELRDLAPDKNRYHVRTRPFTELVADTLTVAVINDGKAISKVFAGIPTLAQDEKFRDFTLLHDAAKTPFDDPYLSLAPARSELWRRFGDTPKEPWSAGVPAIFSASAEILDGWVASKPRDEYKNAVTINKALLDRLAEL